MEIQFSNDKSEAEILDKEIPALFRDRFYIPKHNNKESIYFCGNSLGLQPKSVQSYIQQELNQWANFGVEGHFEGEKPWMKYSKFVKKQTAKIVGAYENEVNMMNSLTTNLHLLFMSFYIPTKEKFKIIVEANAFSSDQYAIETQVLLKGLNPSTTIIEIKPRQNEYTLRTEDILETINHHKNELALVFIGGVNFLTGQAFDMKTITQSAQQVGAKVGFDLAHAVGNIELKLHDWNVDFAVWCSYKYLNAGPGGVGGAFVHNNYLNANLPRFGGWWGQIESERFKMIKGFKPDLGIDGWALSNDPVLSLATYMASIEIFEEAGIENLIERSKKLSYYLEYLLLNSNIKDNFMIITPSNIEERGCQLSIIFKNNGLEIFKHLQANGVIVDWRAPNIMRITPVPLYNTFLEIYNFVKILENYRII